MEIMKMWRGFRERLNSDDIMEPLVFSLPKASRMTKAFSTVRLRSRALAPSSRLRDPDLAVAAAGALMWWTYAQQVYDTGPQANQRCEV
jgi:hypothetical protein